MIQVKKIQDTKRKTTFILRKAFKLALVYFIEWNSIFYTYICEDREIQEYIGALVK